MTDKRIRMEIPLELYDELHAYAQVQDTPVHEAVRRMVLIGSRISDKDTLRDARDEHEEGATNDMPEERLADKKKAIDILLSCYKKAHQKGNDWASMVVEFSQDEYADLYETGPIDMELRHQMESWASCGFALIVRLSSIQTEHKKHPPSTPEEEQLQRVFQDLYESIVKPCEDGADWRISNR